MLIVEARASPVVKRRMDLLVIPRVYFAPLKPKLAHPVDGILSLVVLKKITFLDAVIVKLQRATSRHPFLCASIVVVLVKYAVLAPNPATLPFLFVMPLAINAWRVEAPTNRVVRIRWEATLVFVMTTYSDVVLLMGRLSVHVETVAVKGKCAPTQLGIRPAIMASCFAIPRKSVNLVVTRRNPAVLVPTRAQRRDPVLVVIPTTAAVFPMVRAVVSVRTAVVMVKLAAPVANVILFSPFAIPPGAVPPVVPSTLLVVPETDAGTTAIRRAR